MSKITYVWIVSRADAAGKTAEVIYQSKTREQCEAFIDHGTNGPNLGYEGPVPRHMYPVGQVHQIAD